MREKNYKNQKGITLIALVVTIVVLLILAGITITMLFSENGIIKKAQEAKNATEQDALNTEGSLTNLAGDLNNILNEYGVNGGSGGGGDSTGINASAIANAENKSQYYGKTVNYTVTDETIQTALTTNSIEWQIFYADEGNIYLIASDYVPLSTLPKPINADGTKGTAPANTYSSCPLAAPLTNVLTSYSTGSARITGEKLQNLNKSYFIDKKYSSANDNMKAVAYLMDTEAWSSFKGTGADYVIGGPTLEMLMKSYSEKYANDESIQGIKDGVYKYQAKAVDISTNITLKQGSVGCAGYVVNNNYGADDSWATYYSGMLPTSDSLYINDTGTSKAKNYWLVSPSANGVTCVMIVNYIGGVSYNGYDGNIGFRPLVSLKSDVQLKKGTESDGADFVIIK